MFNNLMKLALLVHRKRIFRRNDLVIDGADLNSAVVIMMINKFDITILQINNNSVVNLSSLYQYIINI